MEEEEARRSKWKKSCEKDQENDGTGIPQQSLVRSREERTQARRGYQRVGCYVPLWRLLLPSAAVSADTRTSQSESLQTSGPTRFQSSAASAAVATAKDLCSHSFACVRRLNHSPTLHSFSVSPRHRLHPFAIHRAICAHLSAGSHQQHELLSLRTPSGEPVRWKTNKNFVQQRHHDLETLCCVFVYRPYRRHQSSATEVESSKVRF